MQPSPPADRPFDVLGIGAASIDFVHVLPSRIALNVPSPTKRRIDRRRVLCGGQVATTLATSVSFGLRATFAGAIGNDENGARVRRELVSRGVDVTDAIVCDAPNQYAIILVDERSGERTILWDRHPGLALSERDLRPGALAAARVVHVDDVDVDAAIRAATLARAVGAVVTTDIDEVTGRTMELVSASTFPIFAEHVPSAITGIDEPGDALRALRRTHPGVLCATLGARGAIALDGSELVQSPAFVVEAVDTTGAGDVFRGGFIYGYLQGWSTARTLRFANAAAALSCTRFGAMASVPFRDEVERLLQLG